MGEGGGPRIRGQWYNKSSTIVTRQVGIDKITAISELKAISNSVDKLELSG